MKPTERPELPNQAILCICETTPSRLSIGAELFSSTEPLLHKDATQKKQDCKWFEKKLPWMNSSTHVLNEHYAFLARERKRKCFLQAYDEHWLWNVICKLGSYRKK